MRILIVSDSHGAKWNFIDVVNAEPTAEIVYFLGDGYREYEDIMSSYGNEKMFIGVLGNCDLGANLPMRDIRNVGNAKIYATHGFQEKVKFGLTQLWYEARQSECNLVLFGHTHEKYNRYDDGTQFFNPGSLRDGFYGVADITDKGIICINKSV